MSLTPVKFPARVHGPILTFLITFFHFVHVNWAFCLGVMFSACMLVDYLRRVL